MITGAIKGQIDKVWDSFWSGGISNPLEVIEQITYLLFLRRLDDLHTLEENKSARLKKPMGVFGKSCGQMPASALLANDLAAPHDLRLPGWRRRSESALSASGWQGARRVAV